MGRDMTQFKTMGYATIWYELRYSDIILYESFIHIYIYIYMYMYIYICICIDYCIYLLLSSLYYVYIMYIYIYIYGYRLLLSRYPRNIILINTGGRSSDTEEVVLERSGGDQRNGTDSRWWQPGDVVNGLDSWRCIFTWMCTHVYIQYKYYIYPHSCRQYMHIHTHVRIYIYIHMYIYINTCMSTWRVCTDT